MANEDLIYRLTKAVYSRLGGSADEQAVEQLVTELYREVEPFLGSNGGQYTSFQPHPSNTKTSSQAQEGSSGRMVISVFGVDHPGIVAGVTQILAAAEGRSSTSTDGCEGQVCDGDHCRHCACTRERDGTEGKVAPGR